MQSSSARSPACHTVSPRTTWRLVAAATSGAGSALVSPMNR
jgi:hypothetical protein